MTVRQSGARVASSAVAVKAAATIRSAPTHLADPDLQFYLPAGMWQVHVFGRYSASAVGVSLGFSGTVTRAGLAVGTRLSGANGARSGWLSTLSATLQTTITPGSSGDDFDGFAVQGVVDLATAGTLAWYWAPPSGTAQLDAGASLTAVRVG